MAHAFRIDQDDLLPALQGRAIRRRDGYPIPMAGATAVFFMRASGPDGAIVASGVATILGPTQFTPEGLNLSYHFGPGQTATPGYFQGQFEVRYPGGYKLSVPGARRLIPIVVGDDIA